MVVQIAAVVLLPIIMLIVAASPFDEPIRMEPIDKNPASSQNVLVTFFIIWMIWVLLLTRILYQIKKGTYKVKK